MSSSSASSVSRPSKGSILSYEHLSYSVSTKQGVKLLVDDISLDIRAGELLAIMVRTFDRTFRCTQNSFVQGPSGSGKSTLLDLMAFRKACTPGGKVSVNTSSCLMRSLKVLNTKAALNGRPLSQSSVAKVSCFVEQEDALLGVLTVRESITYALRLQFVTDNCILRALEADILTFCYGKSL